MAQIVYGARHFVEYVTWLAVSRETTVLEGTAVTTRNSILTLRKVVSRGRVVSGTRDHINRASDVQDHVEQQTLHRVNSSFL